MNILIIGCGRVGSELAELLDKRGHDVSVIDRRPENFDRLPGDFSGFTTTGVPIDQNVLRKAGIESCDAVCAVAQDDDLNIMAAQMAKEIFGVQRVFARISDVDKMDVFKGFGLHTVCPTVRMRRHRGRQQRDRGFPRAQSGEIHHDEHPRRVRREHSRRHRAGAGRIAVRDNPPQRYFPAVHRAGHHAERAGQARIREKNLKYTNTQRTKEARHV